MSSSNNGLPIEILEVLAKLKLTSSQQCILYTIWLHQGQPISSLDITVFTGLEQNHVRAEVRDLVKYKIIIRKFDESKSLGRGMKPLTIINTDIEQWDIPDTLYRTYINKKVSQTPYLSNEKGMVNGAPSGDKGALNGAGGTPKGMVNGAPLLDNNDSNTNNSASLDNKYSFDVFYPSSDVDDVLLTRKQYEKLILKFGEQGTAERVEELSLYMARKDVTYKDHYAQILTYERYKTNPNQGQTQKSSRRENNDPDKYIKGRYGHIVQR